MPTQPQGSREMTFDSPFHYASRSHRRTSTAEAWPQLRTSHEWDRHPACRSQQSIRAVHYSGVVSQGLGMFFAMPL